MRISDWSSDVCSSDLDLAGKIAELPCHKLLGGLDDKVCAYASSGTLRDPQAMAETARRFLECGFGAMKIRFHRGDWQDDIHALEAVRDEVGDAPTLLGDYNQKTAGRRGGKGEFRTVMAWGVRVT